MAEKKELPTRKSNIRSACYCYYCCFCHWCGAAAAVAASASAVGGIVDGLQLCAWMIEQILNLISQYILYILEMFLTVFYFGLVVNVSVRIEISKKRILTQTHARPTAAALCQTNRLCVVPMRYIHLSLLFFFLSFWILCCLYIHTPRTYICWHTHMMWI